MKISFMNEHFFLKLKKKKKIVDHWKDWFNVLVSDFSRTFYPHRMGMIFSSSKNF